MRIHIGMRIALIATNYRQAVWLGGENDYNRILVLYRDNTGPGDTSYEYR